MKRKKLCRNCEYFEYQIHHHSSCDKDKTKRYFELRDGRAIACEKFKIKGAPK